MKHTTTIRGTEYKLDLAPISGDGASHTVTLEVPGNRRLNYDCDGYQQALETFNTCRDTLAFVRDVLQ